MELSVDEYMRDVNSGACLVVTNLDLISCTGTTVLVLQFARGTRCLWLCLKTPPLCLLLQPDFGKGVSDFSKLVASASLS